MGICTQIYFLFPATTAFPGNFFFFFFFLCMSFMAAFSCDILRAEPQYQSKEGNICHAKNRGGCSFEGCNFYCNIYNKALIRRKGNFIHSVDLSASVVCPQIFFLSHLASLQQTNTEQHFITGVSLSLEWTLS